MSIAEQEVLQIILQAKHNEIKYERIPYIAYDTILLPQQVEPSDYAAVNYAKEGVGKFTFFYTIQGEEHHDRNIRKSIHDTNMTCSQMFSYPQTFDIHSIGMTVSQPNYYFKLKVVDLIINYGFLLLKIGEYAHTTFPLNTFDTIYSNGLFSNFILNFPEFYCVGERVVISPVLVFSKKIDFGIENIPIKFFMKGMLTRELR